MCIFAFYSSSAIKIYTGNAKDVISRLVNHESLRNDLYKVSEDYKHYDCIYIEVSKDNLFHGLWFEFGDYDEFKKITIDDFKQYGISKKSLNGRKSMGDIIIYAPKECTFNESYYKLLVSDSTYNIFQLIEGNR